MDIPTVEAAVTAKDYLPILGAAVGGFIGTAGGFFSKWWWERSRRQEEARQLAHTFKGEILAILAIAETREYVTGFKRLNDAMKSTGRSLVFPISITREYFNVYTANVSKLGMLRSPLPELIARFYTQGNSILEDFASRGTTLWQQAPVNVVIELHEKLIALMEDTFTRGRDIAARIDTLYR